MTRLEDRLTEVLTRTADAVEVRPDIDRVRDQPAVVTLDAALGRSRRPDRRWTVVATGAAAASVAIGALLVTRTDRSQPVDVVTPSAGQATAPADATVVPRFLVTAPGWEVTWMEENSDEEFGGHVGEATIQDGSGRSIALNWYPASHFEGRVDDLLERAGPATGITIDGRDAQLFDYGASSGIVAAWWSEGDTVFELRGDNFTTTDDFRAVAATVEDVDRATWLAALPEEAVAAARRGSR
ncbi:MAG: hypothetical protein JXA83_01345 [Acidimicrobiales bacterium]|nr:hypothetical protein [Acidimicrobiales bacterium]